MTLSKTELNWLEKRRTLVALWPWAGGGIIAGLLGFAAWLWLAVPLMINPWAAVEAIRAEQVEQSTLIVMAVMLPILMLACLGVLVVAIGLFFVAFTNEKKLIRMVDKLSNQVL